MRDLLLFLSLFCSVSLMAQSSADVRMEKLIAEFEKEYYRSPPPSLSLDFKANLHNELQTRNIKVQKTFFSKLLTSLKSIETEELRTDLQLDFQIISYECRLNLKRLDLIEKSNNHGDIAPLESVFEFNHGPEWYAWFTQKWTGTDMSPEEILAFGEREVERVKSEISQLNISQTKPADQLTRDVALIVKTLKEKKQQIKTKLEFLFPAFPQLPDLHIQRGTNPAMAQAPGYYNNNIFYFNLFDKPFDLADCDWMLIHEGSPGHHFQVNYHNHLSIKPYRAGLRYMGFIEGWAAYTENLGREMGLYQHPYEALGKWKWDIIRSVRIVLDVGLNYYGWTDQKALAYWQEHIKGQDDIAAREIARMKRWPAQVLTYKLGEAEILRALKEERNLLGADFSYKSFHTRLLNHGSIPVTLIAHLVKQQL